MARGREERGGDDLEGPELSPETSAIVVGYGRFGQTVAQMLQAKRIPVTLIDSKPSRSRRRGVRDQGLLRRRHRIDLLRTAGAETAKAILFCNDMKARADARGAEAVLEAFRRRRHGPGLRPPALIEFDG